MLITSGTHTRRVEVQRGQRLCRLQNRQLFSSRQGNAAVPALSSRTEGFPAGHLLSRGPVSCRVCSISKEPLYSLDITDLKTPSGNTVREYCVERSLCDVLRPQNHTDIQIVTDALKRYVSRKREEHPMLPEYALRLRVEERLRGYLEILL